MEKRKKIAEEVDAVWNKKNQIMDMQKEKSKNKWTVIGRWDQLQIYFWIVPGLYEPWNQKGMK